MTVYLDASVIAGVISRDVHNARADAFLKEREHVLVVSDFAAAEFASVIARRV